MKRRALSLTLGVVLFTSHCHPSVLKSLLLPPLEEDIHAATAFKVSKALVQSVHRNRKPSPVTDMKSLALGRQIGPPGNLPRCHTLPSAPGSSAFLSQSWHLAIQCGGSIFECSLLICLPIFVHTLLLPNGPRSSLNRLSWAYHEPQVCTNAKKGKLFLAYFAISRRFAFKAGEGQWVGRSTLGCTPSGCPTLFVFRPRAP